MAQCNIEGALKFIENLHNSIPSDDKAKQFGKQALKEIFDTVNSQRALLQEAGTFAGAEATKLTVAKVTSKAADTPKNPITPVEVAEEPSEFEDYTVTDTDTLIDSKGTSLKVLKELFELNKEVAVALYNTATSFVVSNQKARGGSFGRRLNTLFLFGNVRDNETTAHELIHSLQGSMTVNQLSEGSRKYLNTAANKFLNLEAGVDEATYQDVFQKIKDGTTEGLDRVLLEKVYLSAVIKGDYKPQETTEQRLERFGREFTAIIGSSAGFRKDMYGSLSAAEKTPFKMFVDDVLKAIQAVKKLITEIIKQDPAEMLDNPDYIGALKLLDEYLQQVVQKPVQDTKGDFDEELNKVLTKKLQELYPEISLVLTEDTLTESEGALYQKTSLEDEVETVKSLDLGVVTKGLQALYPQITSADVSNVIARYGKGRVDAAITALSNTPLDVDHVALPLEYSLVYVDLLQNTTFMKNSIRATAKAYKVSLDDAKITLATKMAEYVLYQSVGGSTLTDKEISSLRKVWNNVVKVFNTLFNSRQMFKERSNRAAVLLAGRLMEGINHGGLTLKPGKGTALVDPAFDFKNQPFAASIVEDVMSMSGNAAVFTGSEALAMQGNIYRKQGEYGTDLHDLDFAVPDLATIKKVAADIKNKYTAYEAYSFYTPKSISLGSYVELLVDKVPSLLVVEPLARSVIKRLPKNNVTTLVVVPKEYQITNLKRFNGKQTGRIVSYDIVDKDNKVVGTYRADVQTKKNSFRTEILGEQTTGVKAVFVDLLESKTKSAPATWKTPNGVVISIKDHKDIFDAKNNISSFVPRNKDVVDFNSFYNPSFGASAQEQFQRNEDNQIKGKADLESKTVFINTLLQTQDTLPHEYAHHYISWFRDTEIVQEAIKKWGSEEALVQAIGEQVVKQKGEAYSWWKEFTSWLRTALRIDKADKEQLKNLLTDAFLTRANLAELTSISSGNRSYKISGDMTTNEGQTAAIDAMIEWFKGNKSSTFLLQGRGGTGKTTVINVLLRELGISPSQVVFATPTNKARKVIETANAKSTYSRSAYYTVAQLLGIKPKTDDEGNQTFIEDPYAHKPPLAKVLVIDEASMLHSENYEGLLHRARSEGTRIIFMGDNAQLPPIGDPKATVRSVVFDANQESTVALNQLMRQAEGSPIINFTDKLIRIVNRVEAFLGAGGSKPDAKTSLRKVLFDGETFNEFNPDKNTGVVLTDSSFDELLDNFLRDLKDNPLTTKYINFNNFEHANTIQKNGIIRNALYGSKADEEMFIAGEPLMLNAPYTVDPENGDAATMLDNGEEFTVVSSSVKKKHIVYLVGTRLVSTKEMLEVYEVIATDNVTGRTIKFDKPTGTKQDVRAFIENEKESAVAKGLKPGSVYMLNNVLALGLSHGYIINSHRSQGSTYDNVYMDLGNIAGQYYSEANDIIKSLYVAASRPRNKLVVIDNRPSSSGNQLVNPIKASDAVVKPKSFENINEGEASDIIKQVDNCKSKGV